MPIREMSTLQYRKEFHPSATNQTIRNWIKRGFLQARRTPTGRWIICVPDSANDSEFIVNPKADELLRLMNGS